MRAPAMLLVLLLAASALAAPAAATLPDLQLAADLICLRLPVLGQLVCL